MERIHDLATLLWVGGLLLSAAGGLILLALGLAARDDASIDDFWRTYDD